MTSSIIPSQSILNIWQLIFNSWQPRTITLLKFVVDKKLASINICTAVWLKQKKLAAFLTYKTFTEYFSNLKQYLNCQVLKIIFQNFTYMC